MTTSTGAEIAAVPLEEREALLEVEHLRVSFRTEDGVVQAVDDVSFALRPGEILAVVGESGSGKSVTGMTLMGLTRSPNARIEGSAKLAGRELLDMSERELNRVRGEQVSMIFQDPMTALNPVHRVGAQIVEQIRAHRDVSKREAYDLAVDLLERVGVPRARERARSYPHEFSGGMRQRVMIAMALSCSPSILIADEPTTALDVTIQAQILREIKQLCAEEGTAVVMITHDLGVVADVADRAIVMYSGRVVEHGTIDEIFYDPQHPYTWGLLGSISRVDEARPDRLPAIGGLPPSLLHAPSGCHFRTRCPHAFGTCAAEIPELIQRGGAPGHLDRCFLTPEEKRAKRVVANGRIGLEAPVSGATANADADPEEVAGNA